MSGLALVARSLGATVTGSDRAESSYWGPLRAARIEPALGHHAGNLPAEAEVVVSTAIPEDNPELAAARAAGATVLHRGDLLAELSRMKRTIAVGGHPWQDHHSLDGRSRAARMRPRAGFPDRRRAPGRRHERRLGRR